MNTGQNTVQKLVEYLLVVDEAVDDSRSGDKVDVIVKFDKFRFKHHLDQFTLHLQFQVAVAVGINLKV